MKDLPLTPEIAKEALDRIDEYQLKRREELAFIRRYIAMLEAERADLTRKLEEAAAALNDTEHGQQFVDMRQALTEADIDHIGKSVAEAIRLLRAERDTAANNVTACHDCGLAYGEAGWIDAIVPNDVWAKINPNDHLLCITCICRRCTKVGIEDVPVMLTSGALDAKPHTPFTGHPDLFLTTPTPAKGT